MDELSRKLLGEGPYPFPVDNLDLLENMNVCMHKDFLLVATKTSIDLFEGVHCHESYEFLVPFTDMQYAKLDKKSFRYECNKLFPINPEQMHGVAETQLNCRLMSFQIDKDYMNEVSHMFCNKTVHNFKNEHVPYDSDMHFLSRIFAEEARNKQAGYEFILDNLKCQLAINLLRRLKSNLPVLVTEQNYQEKDNINRAIEYMRYNYIKSYTLEEIANVANLSPYHFIRVFKAQTGKTPYNFLLEIKIEKALELLKGRSHSITEICFLCGFNNLEHFAGVFKRKVRIFLLSIVK